MQYQHDAMEETIGPDLISHACRQCRSERVFCWVSWWVVSD